MAGSFNKGLLRGSITPTANGYQVEGSAPVGSFLLYQAASPTRPRLSVSGRGLPFASPTMARDTADNSGVIQVTNGTFTFHILPPNSYYNCLGKVLVPPQLQIVLLTPEMKVTEAITITLGPPVANRSLTGLPGRPVRATGR